MPRDTLSMFFRPDQARELFFACRDNDERLAFVGKVSITLISFLYDAAGCLSTQLEC
jgi:hypothetical protein